METILLGDTDKTQLRVWAERLNLRKAYVSKEVLWTRGIQQTL